jgi:anti-anti-sigma factor
MSVDSGAVNVEQDIVTLEETASWRGEPLHVSVHAMEDFTLVILTGEVCRASVPILYRHFADITSDVRKAVVVDLGLATFLDTHGLSFLIAAHKHLALHGSQLILFSPSLQVRRMFRLTGLESYFAVVPD